jgi:hypothetical protein
MDYDDVLNAVRGRGVSVWTCNTCSKLCNNMGGQGSAERLADRLKDDGVNVVSVNSVSAACLMSKVIPKAEDVSKNADVVISLTCDIGVTCAAKAFKKDILAPLVTLGYGYMDDDGSLLVLSSPFADAPSALERIIKDKGLSADPLV